MSEEATNSEELTTEDETSLPESAEQSETQEKTETEGEGDEPKRPTAKDRIAELTRLRREAEREAEYWKAKAIQAPVEQSSVAQQPAASERPDPEQFEAGEFDTRYIEALADWKAEQTVKKHLEQFQQQSRQHEADRAWQSRVARASERLPDFEEKVVLGAQRNEWSCTAEMADALRSSDKGEDLAYHLATNPDEAARIARLSPALQMMELGKLEAKLIQPKPNAVTKAPEPIPQSRGSGGRFSVNPDTSDFAAFDKAYGNG